jgi:cytochrome c oxidase subunit 4
MSPHTRTLVLVWLALMVLLGLTFGSTFLSLGPLKPVVNIGIALAKAALIFWFFMHLREVGGLIRLAAFAGLVGIIIMMALISSDYLTRATFAPPL